MTEEWRKAVRYRKRLWKIFTRDRTDNNYKRYKAQRNTKSCTSLKRKAIREFFSKNAKAENPRDFGRHTSPSYTLATLTKRMITHLWKKILFSLTNAK